MNDSQMEHHQLRADEKETMGEFARKMFNAKLAAIRAQLPFVPIMPFPNASLAYKLAANTPQDINLPSGTKLILFSGNGEYYVNRKGVAQVPTGVHEDGTGSIQNPEFAYLYVEEIQQLSVVAPLACNLTVHCFIQL